MKLTKEKFGEAYKQKYLAERLANLERNIEKIEKVENITSKIASIHLRINKDNLERELRRALWFFDLIIPIFNPKDKLIKFYKTYNTRFSNNSNIVARVLSECGGNFVEKLEEANTAIYWGRYLCDYAPNKNFPSEPSEDNQTIYPILWHVKNIDITALLFYIGKDTYEYCYPHCLEPKQILELQKSGKHILEFPLGWPYHQIGYNITTLD